MFTPTLQQYAYLVTKSNDNFFLFCCPIYMLGDKIFYLSPNINFRQQNINFVVPLYPGDNVQNCLSTTLEKFCRRRISSQESDLVRASTPPPLIGNFIWCK